MFWINDEGMEEVRKKVIETLNVMQDVCSRQPLCYDNECKCPLWDGEKCLKSSLSKDWV